MTLVCGEKNETALSCSAFYIHSHSRSRNLNRYVSIIVIAVAGVCDCYPPYGSSDGSVYNPGAFVVLVVIIIVGSLSTFIRKFYLNNIVYIIIVHRLKFCVH